MNIRLDGLKLSAVSCCLPQDILNIRDLASQFGDTEVKRIAMSTGINSVRIANNKVKASDLCYQASQYTFKQLNIDPKSIDGLVFISQTSDYRLPATSCILQDKLNLRKDIVCFDINYGCSGYIYGLYQAALLISSGSCNKVLVCVGDTISDYLDPNDHKVRLVFGDAGSATIIESGDDNWGFDINTDGSGHDKLLIPKDYNNHDGYLHMDGSAIMEFALREVHKSFNNVLAIKKWNKDSIKHVVMHQANKFMLSYLRKKMRLLTEQVPIMVQEYGNTGPTSIPLTLCASDRSIDKYEESVLIGFGVGLSWGSIALDLSKSVFYKPIFL
jgi:3-oxoacyl-[acyl-carrier-protein] synthase-3